MRLLRRLEATVTARDFQFGSRRPPNTRHSQRMERRVVLVGIASAVVAVAAVWFASGWIAEAPDGTCGSVFRSDIWWGDDGCTSVMSLRLLVSVGIGAVGLAALVSGIRHRLHLSQRLAVVGLALAAAALVLNEAVRDGGVFT